MSTEWAEPWNAQFEGCSQGLSKAEEYQELADLVAKRESWAKPELDLSPQLVAEYERLKSVRFYGCPHLEDVIFACFLADTQGQMLPRWSPLTKLLQHVDSDCFTQSPWARLKNFCWPTTLDGAAMEGDYSDYEHLSLLVLSELLESDLGERPIWGHPLFTPSLTYLSEDVSSSSPQPAPFLSTLTAHHLINPRFQPPVQAVAGADFERMPLANLVHLREQDCLMHARYVQSIQGAKGRTYIVMRLQAPCRRSYLMLGFDVAKGKLCSLLFFDELKQAEVVSNIY